MRWRSVSIRFGFLHSHVVLLSESGGSAETGARTFRVSSRGSPPSPRGKRSRRGKAQALSLSLPGTEHDRLGPEQELLIFLYRYYCHRCLTLITTLQLASVYFPILVITGVCLSVLFIDTLRL